jgi:formamidopyrimidine-DNA glycosylase
LFELPEVTVLARQLSKEFNGRRVVRCVAGAVPHKFVWYGVSPGEYEARAVGRTAGNAHARGKWVFLPMEPGYVQVFGETGGRVLLHPAGIAPPAKHHLLLEFDDGRCMTVMAQMWGFIGIMTPEEIAGHQYAGNIGIGPSDPEFTPEYFRRLVLGYPEANKKSVKALLTQDGTVPGIGNAYCQDILFRAQIHPKRKVADLGELETQHLYEEVTGVVAESTRLGGRNDEADLYGRPGGYARIIDRNAAGKPCPACGAAVEKMQYLGGACYYCPVCQQ